jgi:FtsP/CotA-like multicopper oxidase with cupredoxin domain
VAHDLPINDKARLREPIRSAASACHSLNASAIENRRIALASHKMKVIALDGNPVPTPQALDSVFIGAGERVDAIVEMNQPGVWILGSTEKPIRESGLGVVVEYAGQHGQPRWSDPPRSRWDYTIFGAQTSNSPLPQQNIELIFEKITGGAGKFNLWLVNGKPYPHEREFVLQQGTRYRLTMRNRTDDAHPMHLHRHLWELIEINGKKTAGILKDTVVVQAYFGSRSRLHRRSPGLPLPCQHQQHGSGSLFRTPEKNQLPVPVLSFSAEG